MSQKTKNTNLKEMMLDYCTCHVMDCDIKNHEKTFLKKAKTISNIVEQQDDYQDLKAYFSGNGFNVSELYIEPNNDPHEILLDLQRTRLQFMIDLVMNEQSKKVHPSNDARTLYFDYSQMHEQKDLHAKQLLDLAKKDPFLDLAMIDTIAGYAFNGSLDNAFSKYMPTPRNPYPSVDKLKSRGTNIFLLKEYMITNRDTLYSCYTETIAREIVNAKASTPVEDIILFPPALEDYRLIKDTSDFSEQKEIYTKEKIAVIKNMLEENTDLYKKRGVDQKMFPYFPDNNPLSPN